MGPARKLGNRQDISPIDHAVGSLHRTFFHVASLLAAMRITRSLIIAPIQIRKQALVNAIRRKPSEPVEISLAAIS